MIFLVHSLLPNKKTCTKGAQQKQKILPLAPWLLMTIVINSHAPNQRRTDDGAAMINSLLPYSQKKKNCTKGVQQKQKIWPLREKLMMVLQFSNVFTSTT